MTSWGFHAVKNGWYSSKAFVAQWLERKKKSNSLLRKPKAQRVKEAATKNEPVMKNSVQFNEHSSGTVKTQSYYYNPMAEPGNHVTPEYSKTPPREDHSSTINGTPVSGETEILEDPEEIGKRLSERTRIKQRIQTPPPKRRRQQYMADKENRVKDANVNVSTDSVVNGTADNNPKKLLRQPSFLSNSPSPTPNSHSDSNNNISGTAQSTPLNKATTRGMDITPRPFIYASPKEPLSVQMRKRRFLSPPSSSSPQTTKEAADATESTYASQPKRRRIIRATQANGKKRKMALPPIDRRASLKREREEQILQEFNRKREKPSTEANTSTPSSGTTSASPAVFNFGGAPSATPATNNGSTSASSASAATPKPFVFGGNDASNDKPDASGPKPFVVGGNEGSNRNSDATGPKPFVVGGNDGSKTDATGPSSAPPPFVFGKTDNSAGTDTNPAQETPATDSNLPAFNFNSGVGAAAGTASTPGFTAANANDANATHAPTPAADAKPAATSNGASGEGNSAPFPFGSTPAPASDAKPGLDFGSSSNVPPEPPTGGSSTFQFGAANNANANAGVSFQFGDAGGTPATTNSGGSTFQFGAPNTASGTPAPVPNATNFQQQPGFNSTNQATPAAPAPSFGGFGPGMSATKPDPPAANASDFGPAPAFVFGSTSSNTPQPGGNFSSGGGFANAPPPPPAFAANSNPQGAAFFTPPAGGVSFNSNAGATPGFQAPPSAGFTMGGAPPSGASARRRSRKPGTRR